MFAFPRSSLVAIVAVAALATPARAVTCDVNTPSYPSIQSAVDDVNCTQVHIPAGGYGESVVISRSVEIYGDDKNTTGVFGNNGSVFHINPSGNTVNIHDLTISGGQALSGGGIYDDGNALIVNNCIIDSNRVVVARKAFTFSGGAGGGIYLTGQAVATISNSTISNNTATVGGGIAINGVSRPPIAGALIQNCTISQNTASFSGGGIFSILGGLFIDGTTIEDNHVNCVVLATGGGLSTLLGGTVINNSHFLRNNATSSTVDAAGGAINNAGDFLDNTVGLVSITDTDFVSNSTTAYFLGSGGAISNTTAGTINCTRCTIRNNSSGNGGGIDSDRHGVVNLIDSTVSGNTVSGVISAFGGGIRVLDGILTISGSTIDHNHATGLGRGGALYVAGDAGVEPDSSFATPFPTSVSITNSTIANNNADALGGALGGRGGGIYAETTGSLSNLQINLKNVTMAFDSADLLGNEIYHNADAVVLQSKIIAENTIMKSYIGTSPADCIAIVLGNGGTTSNGGNVGTCFSTGGTDINGDPLLSTLNTAGGPTQTVPLTAGSPAINHGTANCPPTDQRRVARDGPCDSGAFEYVDEFLNSRTPSGPAAPGATIAGTFSQNTTAPPNAFAIISELQGTINANLTGNGTTTLTLTPPSPFIVGDNIHVIASNAMQRTDGKPLQNPQQWSFSVNNTTPFCSGGFKQVNTNIPIGYQSFMTWADYDGDGKLDILACGTFSPCDVYHNVAGTFTPLHANLPWLGPVVAAWGDYDGDGKPDFIVSGIDFHTGLPVTKLYHNDGGGSFSEATTTLPQVANGAVAWADYNNDGKLDLLLGGSDKNNKAIVDVYKNTGGGNFVAINSGLPQLSRMTVAWGDFNSDGYPDIIVQGFNILTRVTQAYQNVGNDAFVGIGAGVALAEGSLTWIDFDGDGKLDALVTGLDGGGSAQTVLLLNTGTIFQVQSPPLPPLYRGSVLALDFDGDGLLDLVVTGDTGNTQFSGVYRNLGGGNFALINSGLPRLGQSFIQAGDYDRDGHVDILAFGWNGSTFIAAVEQQIPCSAGDDAFIATQDTPLVVAAPGILANDFEVNPTIVVDTNPASGTLTMNGGGAFTYTPAAGFSGDVAFTYHLTDGAFSTNVATARIHVNPTGTCRATFDSGVTIYASSDNSALQQAIDLAPAGSTIKISGACDGVSIRNGFGATAYINKSLTLIGGYAGTNWTTSDPVANPTTLDAVGRGSVVVIPAAGPVVALDNLVIQNGNALTQYQTDGGDIYNNGGTLSIGQCTITKGLAFFGNGGGLFNTGTVTITKSTINSNFAVNGSGIWTSGPLTLRNTTISLNGGAAHGSGGGLFVNGGGTTINNATFHNNLAGPGNTIMVNAGTVAISNSILSTSGPNCSGAIISNGYNLATDSSCSLTATGDVNNTDPNIGPLIASNGGPTQTFALNTGSPAIDTGYPGSGTGTLCEPIDQRGIGRPQGNRCDIGALESTVPATPALCYAGVVHGTSFSVYGNGTSSGKAIRDAIAVAVAGDTIKIAGTCQGGGGGALLSGIGSRTTDNMFVADKSLTFIGGYNWYFQDPPDPVAHPTILDAQGVGRIAGVAETHTFNTVTFQNLQFINGQAAGTEFGGAIFVDRENSAVISGCTFNNNKAAGSGAIYLFDAPFNPGTLSIDHSAFTANAASTSGGGAYFFGAGAGANVTISDSTFKSNTSARDGGAILFPPQVAGEHLTLTRDTFESNSASSTGAAVNAIGTGGLTISDCTFKSNSGAQALGIFLQGTADVVRTTFDSNNSAGFAAGALSASGVNSSKPLTLNVTDSTFVNNTGAGGQSGGIGTSNFATVNITGSTFAGNMTTGTGQGGAIALSLGTTAVTITESTFSGNTASFGGAIEASAGTLLIKSSTFNGNTGTSGEAGTLGAIGAGVTITMQNNILANSIVNGVPFDPTCHSISGAVFTSLGNNMSTDAATGCGFIGTDLTNANAALDVLADNGGPTKTHALLASSAALDHGSCTGLTLDQRHFARPIGAACDIGSFERQAYSTTITAVQSAASSVVGEMVTFTATVTPSGPGTPTGAVSFGSLGTVPLAANGTATITAPFNTIVSSILISYSGDANFNASTVTLPHTVTPATSFINLISVTPNSASSGTALTATFAIGVLPPGVATASGGTVTVSDGVESCTAIAPATQCALTLHSLGARTIAATYSGDARLTASTSAPLPHTVTLAIVPILMNILPFQDTANHRITNGQIVNVPLSQMSLVFNEGMNAPLSASDPTSVQNPANYLLVGDGGDGVLSTTVCTAPSPSDVAIRVDPIFYGSNTATLNLNGGTQIPDGKYRLLICPTIQDTLGNQLGAYTIDFSVDTTVPSVTLVNSVADTGDGVLAENEGTTVAITQLSLTFSEAINTTDATSTASYKLIAAGPNRIIDSTACATGVLGDDVSIPINTATYNSTTHIVTLGINGGTLLPDSLYRLFACGSSIHNLATTPMAADFVRNFAVDHNPPTDPTSLASTTHAIGGWSRLNQITMQWSGATDAVAVAGYSIVFDSIAGTVPDTTIEVPQSTDPHSTTSAVLPDGPQYYFHLRTCDFSGNCTTGLHRGPYMIDTTAPSIPTNVQSTSHQVNVASINPHIAMTWSASTDALSGVAGYSFAFNQTAAATCDQIMKQTGTTVTSGALSAGSWYFHVCTVDVAGNWSADAVAGPFPINGATAPKVTNVSLTENEATRGPVTQLVVTFDQDVNVPAAANFLLLSPGANGTYDTVSCAAGLIADDVKTTIGSVSYSAALHQATLNVSALSDARYRLLVCASIQNIAALPLDGNGDGIGGDDFPRNFLVDTTPPTIPANITNTNSVGQLSMTWSLSTDALSGVAGYSYAFDQNATWTCDQVQKVSAGTTTASSSSLVPGGWYFHICAADNLENWSAAANAGPFTVTPPPATVLKVNTVADTGDGVLAENESTNIAITKLLVTFDHDPPNPSNVANYVLIAAGVDETFETVSCAAGVAATDVAKPITTLTYDTVGHIATLNVASLPDSHYRLIVCAALSGADFVRNFTVDTTPPALPVTIGSSDHQTGVVSSNPFVTITWSPSADLLSSVAGYDVVFDQNPATPCGRTQNLPGTATTATSPSLTTGSWYFHLCTVDTVGNWSGTSTQGPFIIAAGAIPTLSPALLMLLAAAMALIAIRATR